MKNWFNAISTQGLTDEIVSTTSGVFDEWKRWETEFTLSECCRLFFLLQHQITGQTSLVWVVGGGEGGGGRGNVK